MIKSDPYIFFPGDPAFLIADPRMIYDGIPDRPAHDPGADSSLLFILSA